MTAVLKTETADDWIMREIANLAALRERIRLMDDAQLEAAVQREEESALHDDGNLHNEGRDCRVTIRWIRGSHALRAKVYRAALADRRRGPMPGGETVVPFARRPASPPATPGAA